MVLRNVVPRQGTETITKIPAGPIAVIEKCSSPTGDGNDVGTFVWKRCHERLRNVVPRQGTETCRSLSDVVRYTIEKCSSPTGDGNHKLMFTTLLSALRNVVPRQGTETGSMTNVRHCNHSLRNVVPRQGTETTERWSIQKKKMY